MADGLIDWQINSVIAITSYCTWHKRNNHLHLPRFWQWHFKYSEWQSWRLTTIRAVFNIPHHLIEPMTQIVIYLFQIRDIHSTAITELVNIHHFAPKDYTSYLKWYSIKYDRRNTEWSVLAWIWLMLWKKLHFIGIKIQVKITWGNNT